MKRVSLLALALVLGHPIPPIYAAQDAADLVEALREDDPSAVKVTQSILAKMGKDAVPPLTKALGDSNFLLRQRAAETLGAIGPEAAPAVTDLVDLLLDAQYGVSEAAAKALVQIGEAAIPVLTRTIVSDDAALRREALSVLAQCGPKAIPILCYVVTKDSHQYMRVRAAELLGGFHPATPEMIDALKKALWDIQEPVRQAAADSLGDHGPAALPALEPLLALAASDQDAVVRKKASEAILKIGPDAVPPLQAQLNGPDPAIKIKAEELLKRLPASVTVSTKPAEGAEKK